MVFVKEFSQRGRRDLGGSESACQLLLSPWHLLGYCLLHEVFSVPASQSWAPSSALSPSARARLSTCHNLLKFPVSFSVTSKSTGSVKAKTPFTLSTRISPVPPTM